jgi:hypothetical protein
MRIPTRLKIASGSAMKMMYRLYVCFGALCEEQMPKIRTREQPKPKIPRASRTPSATSRFLSSGGEPSEVVQQI